jgi:hypothetical protein
MWHYLLALGTAPSSAPSSSTGILPINALSSIPGIQPITTVETGTLINQIIAYAIILAGFLSVVFMLWGGIQFIISGGKEDKVKTATGTIRYAIIGLVVTILAVSVINLIGRVFNLDLVNYVNFDHILELINNLVNFRLN